MKAANMSLQNTTSKPRRGYCSTRTEARADDFTLTCSGHKNSSQHALLGAESWFGRNSSRSVPWTGQSSVKCLLITIRSQGAGLGLPWKGNPDTLAEYTRQRPSLPHTPREQSVGAIQFPALSGTEWQLSSSFSLCSCTTWGGGGWYFSYQFGP